MCGRKDERKERGAAEDSQISNCTTCNLFVLIYFNLENPDVKITYLIHSRCSNKHIV